MCLYAILEHAGYVNSMQLCAMLRQMYAWFEVCMYIPASEYGSPLQVCSSLSRVEPETQEHR